MHGEYSSIIGSSLYRNKEMLASDRMKYLQTLSTSQFIENQKTLHNKLFSKLGVTNKLSPRLWNLVYEPWKMPRNYPFSVFNNKGGKVEEKRGEKVDLRERDREKEREREKRGNRRILSSIREEKKDSEERKVNENSIGLTSATIEEKEMKSDFYSLWTSIWSGEVIGKEYLRNCAKIVGKLNKSRRNNKMLGDVEMDLVDIEENLKGWADSYAPRESVL